MKLLFRRLFFFQDKSVRRSVAVKVEGLYLLNNRITSDSNFIR